jgi:catechol 2,3-dioxygenase-like lactoylglutathione lyase family enzyme
MDIYVTLGARDLAASQLFYDAVLGALGWRTHQSFDGWRAYSEGGRGEGTALWLCRPYDGQAASAGNGAMVGFMAASRAQVDAFHAAALAHGGVCEGAPGVRDSYGPNWYAAYVRDPVGNKLAAVLHG